MNACFVSVLYRHKHIHRIVDRRTKFNYTFRFPFTHTTLQYSIRCVRVRVPVKRSFLNIYTYHNTTDASLVRVYVRLMVWRPHISAQHSQFEYIGGPRGRKREGQRRIGRGEGMHIIFCVDNDGFCDSNVCVCVSFEGTESTRMRTTE